MGDKIETGECSYCCDMPMELLTEILIRLPVKSLVRFTVVCKFWLRLITNDPQFAMRHYLTKIRTSPTSLMDNVDHIVDYFGKYGRRRFSTVADEFLRLCIHSLTEEKTFRLEKKLEFGPELDLSVSNFHHGLMCVYVSSSYSYGARLLLCNPAIREVVPLPLPPPHVLTSSGLPILPLLGLGFDPINNNYKVVIARASGFRRLDYWEVGVYSVRDGLWHTLPVRGPLDPFNMLFGEPTPNANGSILNWFGFCDFRESKMCLLSFDMVHEVFQEVIMPERLYHILTSSGREACISCTFIPSFDLRKDGYSDGIDIWVLNRDEDQQMSWNKRFSVAFPDDTLGWPANFWMNDKELFLHVLKEGDSTEEVYHYNRLTRQLTRTGRLGALVNPDGYAESLISIKQIILTSCLQAGEDEEEDDEEGPVCFMREVGVKNSEVCWSYSFKLRQTRT